MSANRQRLVALILLLLPWVAWGQVTAVNVTRAELRDMELVSMQPGSAEAFFEADLGAKVSGYVSELRVDIGSRVTQGQVLARITVPELSAQLAATAASVAAAESEYERMVVLVERGSVTERTLTEAQSRLETARAMHAENEARLQYATIEAPFDGTVTLRTIDPGDTVYEASSPKGGDQPLLRVAKVDLVRVQTFVPERNAAWVDIGDSATVTFEALAGRSFSGRVARLSETVDSQTRTMQVEIDLPNDDGRIRPGYYGQARLVLERREQARALPAAAVRSNASTRYVFVVAPGDRLRMVAVETGLESGGWVEITAGLTGDEQVVTAGPATLADGAAVSVVSP